MQLREDDRARVTAAVSAAETGTDGEIVPVVADRSDKYHDVGLHWAVLATLLVPAVAALRPGLLLATRGALDGGWRQAYPLGELLTVLLVIMALTFLLARLLFAAPAIRMVLTPRATKTRRVRRRALEVFRVGIEAHTTSRTGVLLYLSLAERQAEIVADAAIHAKVAPETWGDTMARLIDAVRDDRVGQGIAEAVGEIGAILATHFPRSNADPQELPNRLIQL